METLLCPAGDPTGLALLAWFVFCFSISFFLAFGLLKLMQ